MSLASLLSLPPVKRFLQSGDITLLLSEAAESYSIPDERVSELLDVTDAVLDGQLEIGEVPHLLKEAFALSNADAQAFAKDIVRIRLLPLGDFLPGALEQYKAWGGEGADEVKKIGKESLTALEFTERMVDRTGLEFSELLMKRLAFLLEQRVNGQKTDESLRTFFGRPLTIGGMGLAKEQIDALMTAVTDAVVGVRIITDEEKAAAATAAQNQKTVEPAPEPTATKENPVEPITALEIPPSHDVAAEVPVISSPIQEERREAARPVVATSEVKSAPLLDERPDVQDKKKAEKVKKLQDEAIKTAFKDAVDLALEKAHTFLEEAKIPSAAFADIVGKMLRGIRDQYQTRDVLERDYKAKGGTLTGLMEALREAEDAYKIAVDALGKLKDVETEVTESDAAALEEEEARRADEKFVALTKEAVKPAPAVVELTVGSVAPAASTGASQKKVTDVVAGNRLMGPVEQLGTLTLADFRRLSTNPEEAVRKMEALLSALQKTSYEERIRGILAWRKSPLAKLYITLMNESLNTGVAVAEIAARRRTQGQESLGPAEMQALAKWNEKTRF